jgi:DNA-binding IclR family transcriptional regulator
MAPLGQLRPPDIAGPAIPSILLQPTVHRSFRTLQACARRTGLATSSVQRAIEALTDDEWITDDGGLCHLTDPFLARWVQAADPR